MCLCALVHVHVRGCGQHWHCVVCVRACVGARIQTWRCMCMRVCACTRACVTPTAAQGHVTSPWCGGATARSHAPPPTSHYGGAKMGQDGSVGGWQFASGCQAMCCPVLSRTFVWSEDMGHGASVGLTGSGNLECTPIAACWHGDQGRSLTMTGGPLPSLGGDPSAACSYGGRGRSQVVQRLPPQPAGIGTADVLPRRTSRWISAPRAPPGPALCR